MNFCQDYIFYHGLQREHLLDCVVQKHYQWSFLINQQILQFFAKKMTIAFIISELFSLGVLYFVSGYLIKIFGIEGIVMAQAFDNFIYLLILGVYFRKSLF